MDSDKPQIDKFRDLARELGADESETAFEDAVRGVAHSHATEYTVELAKRGPGWTVVPLSGASAKRFPILETPDAVRTWLKENGYGLLPGEPDRWALPSAEPKT